MDQTGYYSVRALALGGGSLEAHASLNDRLRRIDWSQSSAVDGLAQLLELIKEQNKDGGMKDFRAVEAAIVDLEERRLVRKFLKDL